MSNLKNNWKTLALNGVIALLYGFLALFVPEATVVAIAMYFGIVILLIGVIMLIEAIGNIRKNVPWLSAMIWAVITLIVGGMITFNTEETLSLFVIIIGSWAIIVAILQLYMVTQVDLSKNRKNSMIFNGILMLLFGIILFFNPFQSAAFLVVLSGIIAVVMGILLIVLAFNLKSLIEEIE
jgi:uncharacterized membrane protein HdeD (DUF308 family)